MRSGQHQHRQCDGDLNADSAVDEPSRNELAGEAAGARKETYAWPEVGGAPRERERVLLSVEAHRELDVLLHPTQQELGLGAVEDLRRPEPLKVGDCSVQHVLENPRRLEHAVVKLHLVDRSVIDDEHETDRASFTCVSAEKSGVRGEATDQLHVAIHVEIVAGNQLFDHLGNLLWTAPQIAGPNSATTVADLDGDGALEMVLGHAAVYNDGSLMWNSGLPPGYPQVADMDADGLPEVVLTNTGALALIEHDGTVTDQGLRPTGAPAAGLTWTRPATIHDFDGDGRALPPSRSSATSRTAGSAPTPRAPAFA